MSDACAKEPNEEYSAFINRAAYGKERVRIAREGQDIAAVIPIEDLELLEELEDRIDIMEAFDALEEVTQKGGVISWEQFEAELDRS
jgi:prevent-host-death family protein